jgi:hypothetical protein
VYRVQALECRNSELGYRHRLEGRGQRVKGSGFRVQGSGFRVQKIKSRPLRMGINKGLRSRKKKPRGSGKKNRPQILERPL